MGAFAFVDLFDKDRKPPLRVKALISMLRTEDGGRRNGIRSGYRPNHNFGPPDGRRFYIGQVDFEGGGTIEPGESLEALVTFLSGPGLKDVLVPGRLWRIQEGPKLVATGTVNEVLGDI